MHLNLHTETPRPLLIRACYCNVCTLHRKCESNFRLIKIMSMRAPVNFTAAEVEVLWQNVGVSILFHYGYIHRLSLVLIYLFTAICSVRIVLLFMLGHHDGSVS